MVIIKFGYFIEDFLKEVNFVEVIWVRSIDVSNNEAYLVLARPLTSEYMSSISYVSTSKYANVRTQQGDAAAAVAITRCEVKISSPEKWNFARGLDVGFL